MKNKQYITLAAVVIVLVALAGVFMIGSTSRDQVSLTPVSETVGVAPHAGPSSVAITSVAAAADALNTAAAGGNVTTNARIIKWQSSNFPSDAKVNVILLREVSDDPVSYDQVRIIASNVANSGQVTWTPTASDLDNDGADLYIEVVCSNDLQFKNGCYGSTAPVKAF